MPRLQRPALVWVLRHPKVLLLTAAHVVIDVLLLAAIVVLFLSLPVAAVLLLLPVAYLATFTAVLADAAIVVAVHDSVTAGSVSLPRAVRVAWEHRNPLAAWALRLLFVGLAIRVVAALFGRLGQIFGWAAEIAWTIVALLVVPAIVVDDVPMPEAYIRSRHTLRQTFGARLRGVTGLTVLGVLIAVGAVALLVGAALADSGAFILISWAVFALVLAAYAYVFDAAIAVLGYAVYAHAAQRPLPQGFVDAAVRNSVGVRPSPSP